MREARYSSTTFHRRKSKEVVFHLTGAYFEGLLSGNSLDVIGVYY